MPLLKRCSVAALSKNIARERRLGIPRKRAIAIGLSTLKRACGVKTRKRMTPKQIVAVGKRRRSRARRRR